MPSRSKKNCRSCKKLSIIINKFGAVAEKSTAALRVASLISTRIKYFYGPQRLVPGLGVCVCELYVCKRTYDTRFIGTQLWAKLKKKGF